MVLILDMVKVDHALDHLPVIVDPTGYRTSKGEHHLACSPVVIGIRNLGFDILSKMQ
jgi:hypothetical protein